jgi:hypothetical protein
VHLAVRSQCNLWSDDQRGNNYFQIKFLTVGIGGGLTGPGGGQTVIYTGAGGLTGHPWRSDCPRTGAGGLTGPGGGQTARAYFGRQKYISSAKDFPRFSTDSKFRVHSEIFTDQGEERWYSLGILDNILIRIMNLSKWQL